jgi:hypothetical protein
MRARVAMGCLLAGLVALGIGCLRLASALDAIELDLGRIQGPDWGAEGVSARILPGPEGQARIELSIKRLVLPPPLDDISSVALICPRAVLSTGALACEAGTLRVHTPLLDAPTMPVSFSFHRGPGHLMARIREARFADGRLDLDLDIQPGAWRLHLRGRRLAVGRMLTRLAGFVALPGGMSGSGRVELSGDLTGAGVPDELSLELRGQGLALSDGTGLREAQDLSLSLRAGLTRSTSRWRYTGEAVVDRGQIYLDPHYLEVTDAPLRLALEGTWAPRTRRLEVDRLDYRHPGVLHLTGTLAGRQGDQGFVWDSAEVQILEARLRQVYPTYLQPLIMGGLLELESDGGVTGRLSWRRGGVFAGALDVSDVYLDDKGGRFGLYGARGHLQWGASRAGTRSWLRWNGAHIYRIGLGGSQLDLSVEGSAVRLARPVEVRVLDGALHLDDLVLDGLGTPNLRWRFQGYLTPISMEEVSHALGWPIFGGSLSGVIPAVTYRDGTVRLQGALLIRAFGGDVVIHDLVLQRPFGVAPRLQAQVDLRNLDLSPLTGAFSFGKIEGRLDGHIHDLRMENWRPAAFDARFYTPEGDHSRHRISQRAVGNLASLGGASGAVSRTFMRFFKQFPYDRLGIGCRLRNGVCEMEGVAPAEGGYYIVKGCGLPRIDIIGYNRRVAWDTLVKQLEDATRGGQPTVR